MSSQNDLHIVPRLTPCGHGPSVVLICQEILGAEVYPTPIDSTKADARFHVAGEDF